MFLTKACVFLTLVFHLTSSQDVHEGSPCTLKNGGQGVCVSLPSCAPAIADLKRDVRPETCSFSGFTPIVCCSERPPVIEEDIIPTQPPVPQPTPPSSTAGRISKRKCEEYAKSVFKLVPTFIPREKIKKDLCKIRDGLPLIKGGTEVIPQEFPHMALIGYDTKKGRQWLCGGSLISERFILTAAHCLDDHTRDGVSDPRSVRLGDVDVAIDNETEIQEFGVKSFLKHPEYRTSIKYHDIGLIELDRNVTFDEFVRPACLQVERDIFPSNGIVTGWGKIDYYQQWQSKSGAWNQKLLKALLQHSPFDYCKAKFDGLPKYSTKKVLASGILDDFMLCFGDKTGKKDACQGDSGGPLQYEKDNPYCMYSVLGITSFGNKCGVPDFPAVYTRVSYYVPWIESIVWPGEK